MFDFQKTFLILIIISCVMLGFAIIMMWWYFLYFYMSSGKVDKVPHNNNYSKFGVLVAARDESKVIRKLFDSLKKQTYPSLYFDVWAIVEDESDPTVEICKEYGFNYFVRDRLTPERKTKGFALQEMIDYFNRNNIIYDAYMIFDADNYMDDNYIEIMNDLRGDKVQVGLGYRNFTNANENWLTCDSAAMFAYMNQVTSKSRSYLFHKATLMGTGYFVDKSVIDDAGGWKFTGMTEDIQLTAYCYYHDVYMKYYPYTCFYDEQSPKMKDVHKQHVRWLKGFLSSRAFLKKFGKKYVYHSTNEMKIMRYEFRVGVLPFIIYNLVNSLLFLFSLGLAVAAFIMVPNDLSVGLKALGYSLFQFLIVYLPFVAAAIYIMIKDREHLKFKWYTKVWCALTYFFFFYEFAYAFLDGVFNKERALTWSKIEHTGKQDDDNKLGGKTKDE